MIALLVRAYPLARKEEMQEETLLKLLQVATFKNHLFDSKNIFLEGGGRVNMRNPD